MNNRIVITLTDNARMLKVLGAGLLLALSGVSQAVNAGIIVSDCAADTAYNVIANKVTPNIGCTVSDTDNDSVSPPTESFTVNVEEFFGNDDWTYWGKWNPPEDTPGVGSYEDDLGDLMNWMGNGQSGTWSFDDGADVWETYDDIMFVFVDGVGAIVGYLIDPDSGNTDSGTYATPFLIPPFTATGGGSNSKNVSHVSVYHTENGNGDGGGPPSQIPEPNIVALLGAAFLGLFLIRRRVLKQPS